MPQQAQQQQNSQAQSQGQQGQGNANQAPPRAIPVIAGERLADAVVFNQRLGLSPVQIRAFQRKLGVPADGEIGRDTTRAIYAFQVSRPELTNDGKLGPATMNALDQQADAAQTSGPERKLLSAGEIQEALRFNRSRGYKRSVLIAIQHQVGAVPDGALGPQTIKAIAEWQAEHGLEADGKVGEQTLVRMRIDTSPQHGQRQQGQQGQQHPGEQQAQGRPQAGEEADRAGHGEQQLPEGSVTASFSWLEFRSKGDNKAVPGHLRQNVIELCEQLEEIKKAFDGRGVRINSGYRSPWWNRQVGGASASQHTQGRAADITVDGVSPSRVYQKVLELINQGKIKQGGLGRYSTFTHYDTRGSAARW